MSQVFAIKLQKLYFAWIHRFATLKDKPSLLSNYTPAGKYIENRFHVHLNYWSYTNISGRKDLVINVYSLHVHLPTLHADYAYRLTLVLMGC